MENNQFSTGIKAGSSIAIGYFPVALTFGLLAKTAGLSLIEATAMSIFVYAGASQYMALSLITAGVAPLLIVTSTFVVNIRHFLMTAALNEKMQPARKWVKATYAFGITDETFSMLATGKKGKIPTAFAFGVALIAYGSWVIFTAIGHVIGANLPSLFTSRNVDRTLCDVHWSACPFHERQPQSCHARQFGGYHSLFIIFDGFVNGLVDSRCDTGFFDFSGDCLRQTRQDS